MNGVSWQYYYSIYLCKFHESYHGLYILRELFTTRNKNNDNIKVSLSN